MYFLLGPPGQSPASRGLGQYTFVFSQKSRIQMRAGWVSWGLSRGTQTAAFPLWPRVVFPPCTLIPGVSSSALRPYSDTPHPMGPGFSWWPHPNRMTFVKTSSPNKVTFRGLGVRVSARQIWRDTVQPVAGVSTESSMGSQPAPWSTGRTSAETLAKCKLLFVKVSNP